MEQTCFRKGFGLNTQVRPLVGDAASITAGASTPNNKIVALDP